MATNAELLEILKKRKNNQSMAKALYGTEYYALSDKQKKAVDFSLRTGSDINVQANAYKRRLNEFMNKYNTDVSSKQSQYVSPEYFDKYKDANRGFLEDLQSRSSYLKDRVNYISDGNKKSEMQGWLNESDNFLRNWEADVDKRQRFYSQFDGVKDFDAQKIISTESPEKIKEWLENNKNPGGLTGILENNRNGNTKSPDLKNWLKDNKLNTYTDHFDNPTENERQQQLYQAYKAADDYYNYKELLDTDLEKLEKEYDNEIKAYDDEIKQKKDEFYSYDLSKPGADISVTDQLKTEINELNKKRSAKAKEKSDKINDIAHVKKLHEYSKLFDEKDFNQKVLQGKEKLKNYISKYVDSPDDKSANELIEDLKQGGIGGISSDSTGFENFMATAENDEINTYLYILGKKGEKAAGEYIDFTAEAMNNKMANKLYTESRKNPVAYHAFNILSGRDLANGLYSNVIGVDNYVNNVADVVSGTEPKKEIASVDDMFSGLVSENSGFSEKTFHSVNNALWNMAPSIALGSINKAAGSALFGVSAAGKSSQQVINEGYSAEEALAYGTLNGALEVGMQYLIGGSFGALGKMAKGTSFQNTLLKAISNVATKLSKYPMIQRIVSGGGKIAANAISEGFEEGLQEVIDPFVRNSTLGESNKLSDINWDNVIESAVVGSLMGGAFKPFEIATESRAIAKTYYGIKGDSLKKVVKSFDGIEGLPQLDITNIPKEEIVKSYPQIVEGIVKVFSDEKTRAQYFTERYNKSDAETLIALKECLTAVSMVSISDPKLNNKFTENAKLLNEYIDFIQAEESNTFDMYDTEQQVSGDLRKTKSITADGDNIVYSKSLDSHFPEISLTTEEVLSDIENVDNSSEVSSKVVDNIGEMSKPIVNLKTGMQVEIRRGDIQSIFKNSKFENYSESIKIANIASAESLPKMVKYASEKTGVSNVGNRYLQAPIIVDGIDYNVSINLKSMYNKGFYVNGISVKQIGNAPVKAKMFSKSSSNKRGSIDVSTEWVNGLDKRSPEYASLRIAKRIANKYGLNFVFKDLGKDVNGYFDKRTGKININTKNTGEVYLYTIGHETIHYIQDTMPTEYKSLKEITLEHLESLGLNVDKRVKEKQEQYARNNQKLSIEETKDEIVAESFVELFTDEKFLKELVSTDKSLARKILDVIVDFIDELKKAISLRMGIEGNQEALTMRKDMAMLDSMRTTILGLLETAEKNTEIKNTSTSEKDTKNRYQFSNIKNVDFDKMIRDYPELSESLNFIKSQFALSKEHTINKKAVEKWASKWLKEIGSTYPVETFVDNIADVWDNVINKALNKRTGKNEYRYNFDEAMKRINDRDVYEAMESISFIASQVLEDSVVSVDNEGNITYEIEAEVDTSDSSFGKEIRDFMGKQTIFLDKSQLGELAFDDISLKDFRQKMFGWLNVTKEKGMNLDSFWANASEKFPNVFDPETNSGDQPAKLLEVVSNMKELIKNKTTQIQEVEAKQIIPQLVMDIFDKMSNMPEIKTVADQYRDKTSKLRNDYKAKIEKVKSDSKAKLAELRRDSSRKVKEAKREGKAEAKESFFKQELKRREAETRKSAIEEINKTVKSIQKKIDGTKFAPELVRPMARIVTAIDLFTGRTKSNGEPTNIKNTMDKIRYANTALLESDLYKADYDADLNVMIDTLIENVGDKTINELSNSELYKVKDIVISCNHLINTLNTSLSVEKGVEISKMGESIVNQQKNISMSPIRRFLNKRLYVTNTMRIINLMSEYDKSGTLNKIFNNLNEGVRKAAKFKADADKYTVELRADEKNYKKFITELEKTSLKNRSGDDVYLTHANITELIMTWDRSQGRKHLEISGFEYIEPFHLKKLLKSNTGGVSNLKEAFNKLISVQGNRNRVMSVTESDINKLKSTLNEYDKKFMEQSRKFFDGLSRTASSETYFLLKGREMPVAFDYIPIKVSGDYVSKPIKGVYQNNSIANQGFIKKTNEHAMQPLIIEGLPQKLSNHIDEVASYYGLAAPIRDFNKVWNVSIGENESSVKSAIRSNWGDRAIKYIENTIEDLQKSRDSDKLVQVIGSFWANTIFNANLSVSLAQFSAYSTAGAILSPKALGKGLADGAYVATHMSEFSDEIDKYTGLYFERRQGLSLTELGDISKIGFLDKMNNNKILSKVLGTKWCQQMDCWTSVLWWQACKYEVERGNMSESEWFTKVADLFNTVLEETQPVYDALHRPELIKGTGVIKYTVGMFKAQTLQNLGMITESTGEFAITLSQYKDGKATKEKLNASWKKLQRVCISQTISFMQFALTKGLVALLLHKLYRYRNEDEELTPQSWIQGVHTLFWETIMETFSPVLPINTIMNLITKKSVTLDVFDVSVWDSLNDVTSSIEKFQKEQTADNAWFVARKLLMCAGVPADNINSIIKAAYYSYIDIKNGDAFTWRASANPSKEQKLHLMWKAKDLNDQKMYQRYYDELIDDCGYDILFEYLSRAGENSRDYNKTYEDLIKLGKKESSIKNAMNSRCRKLAAEYYLTNDSKKRSALVFATGGYGEANERIDELKELLKEYSEEKDDLEKKSLYQKIVSNYGGKEQAAKIIKKAGL